jgi:hypothetical protein
MLMGSMSGEEWWMDEGYGRDGSDYVTAAFYGIVVETVLSSLTLGQVCRKIDRTSKVTR